MKELSRFGQAEPTTSRSLEAQLPPPETKPGILGYSVGVWSDDSLIVTTTGIDFPVLTQQGVPLSEDVSLTGRFTPAANGSRLDYALTVNDPRMFTRPLELGKYWIYAPDAVVMPYNCED